ncbi:MAG: zinc-dependent peptidase [Bacteroidota bacterium]
MDIHSFLEKNNAYYQKLDQAGKQLFQTRVSLFIDRKSITGRQNFVITRQVQVILASAAVQVTLGLETWDVDYFNQILIYPSEYKNPQTGNMHKGETNMGGFMCFSWEDFLKGNQTPDDKVNLGLHEFAHALRFSGVNGNETDYFFDNYFKRWLACAAHEYTRMRRGNASILRKYGAVNINEFFSVVVETFFEKPLEFKSKLPELFHQTSILLNQTFSDDGRVRLNCREDLLKQNRSTSIHNTEKALRFFLPQNGPTYAAFIFIIFGVITLFANGYKYPLGYSLIGMAMLIWLYLERTYVRIYFIDKSVYIQKGFFIRSRFDSKEIPLSQVVSFYANYSNTSDDQISSSSVTYYYEGDFYEDDLYFKFSKSDFELLRHQLIENYVHVQVVE